MANIDVIMAACNEEKRISAAIESILSQTYSDWRLLICDDGSQDDTYKIITEYAVKFPEKIIAMKNAVNKGLTYTLNRLISLTTAKYIARMDADDKSKANRFEKQIEFLNNHLEYGMVGSTIEKFDDNSFFTTVKYPEKPENKDFLWNSPFAHPAMMIKRGILIELNGYKDALWTLRCEDYDLWMRIYAKGYKGYNIQTPLLEYYENSDSYKKRKYRYRIAEMKTRLYGYKNLGLMPIGIVYALKPLVVGLIPGKLMIKMRMAEKQ